MSAVVSPGVERWIQCFAKDAVLALDGALTGRMSLGQYDAARPSMALMQMLSNDDIASADNALVTWLEQRIGRALPSDLSMKRYSEALTEAFRVIRLLSLPTSSAWCVSHAMELRAWLPEFNLSESRNPESALQIILVPNKKN